ncbi:beta-carotene 15,15'-monooxygenase [Sphingobacterium sp. HMA12]|uniref:beta-carotene 15,15'-monooxygenase n=1 Tax=Sphingobacterium sp. HMA12 TaxID=2050894 RepID=UPI001315A98C|nr:beta-carotene 15,15'-monooxygenase [Sphingobacterium sp. HMA12]
MTTLTDTHFFQRYRSNILYISLIFFILLSIPYDPNLFKGTSFGELFSPENWFALATYRTSFIPESSLVGTDVRGYYNWAIALGLALLVFLVFGRQLKQGLQADDDALFYWLRVLLRYRLALAMTFIGLVKIIPIQLPEPTISELHTEYGDFLLWKLYYLTNGIATAGYLPVIGALEIVGGLFLLNRRTAVIGAGLLLAVLLNVVIVNYVYEIGEQVYSSFLLLLAIVIFAYDWPRFYRLLIQKTATIPDGFWPVYGRRIAIIRPYLQVLLLLLIAVFSVQAYLSWKNSDYPFPDEKGLAGAAGVYDVKDFVWKGDTLPYSLTDRIRWKDVVFEKWNTISIRGNQPVKVDSLKPRIAFNRERNYEYLGNGGREFFGYSLKKGGEKQPTVIELVGKINQDHTFSFVVNRPDKRTLLLEGTNQSGDTLQVRLEKVNKKYLLHEGRRKPIRIY